MNSTPPTSVIRDGNLKASIWQNEGEKGTYYTTTFAKTYRDQNGDLRDTNAFNQSDLLRISELAKEARTKTRDLRQDLSQTRTTEQSPQRAQEQTPERTQERTPERTPEQQASDRKTRAEAFLQERREDRSLEPDYGMDR